MPRPTLALRPLSRPLSNLSNARAHAQRPLIRQLHSLRPSNPRALLPTSSITADPPSNPTAQVQTRTLTRKHSPSFTPPTPQDLLDLRSATQSFCRAEIPESLAEQTDTSNSFPNALWRKLGDAGFLGITADPAYGGLGQGYEAHAIVMEELSRASGSIALSYAAHSQLCINQICLNGSDAQRERFLPSLIRGERIGALAMSEVGAGSDVVSMRMTAQRVPGGFILNGGKMWITNGPDAHVIVVYAKTTPHAASKGITAFIVPVRNDDAQHTHIPGFTVSRKLDKLGMRGSNTGELVFEDVFVPEENVLGPVDGGVRVLMEGLDLERLVLSAGPIGLMQRALDEVLPYVHSREQFGKILVKNQLVQGKVADMYVGLQASRALTHSVARRIDDNHDNAEENYGIVSRDCTGAILFAAEQGTKVCLDAVQLMGGMGYMSEVPVGRLVRDAKLYEIGAGTSEIRRIVVGRSFEKEYL